VHLGRFALLSLISLAAASAGCRQDEVTVRRVPKEKRSSVALAPASAEASGGPGLHWTAPKDWKETPGDGMRIATFEPPQDSGRVESTVVALVGDAGGELANVNRWRGQLALAPVAQDGLESLRRSVRSRAGVVALYDFAGGDGAKTRMLAGMIKVGEKTWFFKLVGAEKAAAAARPAFLKLLEGLDEA
jgi:hypothetical protein